MKNSRHIILSSHVFTINKIPKYSYLWQMWSTKYKCNNYGSHSYKLTRRIYRHVFVVRGSDQKLRVRGEGEEANWHGVALHCVQQSSTLHVKQVYYPVHRTRCHQLPIRTLRNAIQWWQWVIHRPFGLWATQFNDGNESYIDHLDSEQRNSMMAMSHT